MANRIVALAAWCLAALGCTELAGLNDLGKAPADTAAADAGGCPAPLAECAGACVQTSVDPLNCGGCDAACAEGEICAAGKCVLECAGGTTACAGACVDTALDPAHCGGCGNACGPGEVCSSGHCGSDCVGGGTKCGKACVDTALDPAHCGGCNKACAVGELCSAGQCAVACLGGTTQCGSACVDTALDPAHCGACGAACPPGEVCSAGKCALDCAGGTSKCGNKCVSTETDPANCGGCGKACAQGEVCSAEKCGLVCAGGTTKCGGKCVDTALDPAHCGGCDKACAQGEVCSAGACALECTGGTTKCGSKCVDLQTDPANCGGCGLVCGCSLPCSLGKCSLSCQGGTTKCGCKCVDTQTDPTNCGGCGKPCAPGEVCSAGACAFACLGGATKCGSKCVDLQLDPANCGGCGKACAQGEVCSGGACGLACAGGTTKCGSKCVDVANDPASCGGCGKACAQGEVCVQGACKIACGQGLTNCGGKCADMQGDAANCGGCGKVCAGICTAGACVGTGKHLWSKRFGDASNQMGYGIAADGAGNAFVTGDLQGTADFGGGPLASAGGADIFVAKLDPAGSHLWGKRFGDGSEQHGRDIAVDGAGNVLVTGYFQGSIDFGGGLLTAGGWNVFVAKLDPTGAHLWSKRCTGGDELGWSVAADGAGNVLIAGEFVMTMDCGGGPLVGAGGRDIFVAKLDSTGKHVWSKRFGDSAYQHALSIATDGSDNVLVTGFFEGNIDFGGGLLTSAGADDVFVAKLDKDGKHLWSKRFGDGSGQSADGVVADASGNVLLAGSFGGSVDFGGGPLTSAGKSDIFVAKLDPSGTHLWSKRFGNAGDQYAKSIAVDGQGNAVVTGYFDGAVDFGGGVLPSAGTYDILAAKFAPAGGHLWSKRFGDGSNQLGYDIAADGLGNVLMTGEFQGTVDFGAGPLTSAGLRDIFVAKLGP